jgi:hypothetical protein
MKGRTDGECDENTPPAQFWLRGKKSQRHWAYKAHNCRNIQNDYNERLQKYMLVFLPGFQKGRAQFRPKKAICIVARKNKKKLEKHFLLKRQGAPWG